MNDYRYNPFENVSTAVTITGETHVIPSVSPYTIRLDEVPMKETPSSISLTIAGSAGAEVSAAPAAGEFWPDYSTGADGDDGWNTGTILFNAADAGKTVVVSYVGTGTLVDTRTVHGQAIFTESGAWVCPEGITQVFITMCGGGGGGGGGGYTKQNGFTGGTTSFDSLLSAPGGGGGAGTTNTINNVAGGASGGSGGAPGGASLLINTTTQGVSGQGGGSILGSGAPPLTAAGTGVDGAVYGAGGSGGFGSTGLICGGGGGGKTYLVQILTVVPGASYTVTIGAGGNGGVGSGSGESTGGNGAPGICIIEW